MAIVLETCNKCNLCKTRTNIVNGNGSLYAKFLFVGEAPGAEEDKQGKPFVGRAGKVLDQLLKDFNLNREDVYITNVVKCRPPNNRVPNKEEITSCIYYLLDEILFIRPEKIVMLGKTAKEAFNNFYGMDNKEIKMFLGAKVYYIYHPAYALYTHDYLKLYNDMKKVFED